MIARSGQVSTSSARRAAGHGRGAVDPARPPRHNRPWPPGEVGRHSRGGESEMSSTTANGKAPGKWEAGLTPAMIAQVKIVGAPQWAGAGQIAYVQDHNQRADIYIADARGGVPLLVTADRGSTPVFSGGFGSGYAVAPDGGTLVYTSPEDGKLYAVSTGGGKARRITDGEGGHG